MRVGERIGINVGRYAKHWDPFEGGDRGGVGYQCTKWNYIIVSVLSMLHPKVHNTGIIVLLLNHRSCIRSIGLERDQSFNRCTSAEERR